MNFKNKLRMGFFIVAILVSIYMLVYYFYDGTNHSQSGQGVLVINTDNEVEYE